MRSASPPAPSTASPSPSAEASRPLPARGASPARLSVGHELGAEALDGAEALGDVFRGAALPRAHGASEAVEAVVLLGPDGHLLLRRPAAQGAVERLVGIAGPSHTEGFGDLGEALGLTPEHERLL